MDARAANKTMARYNRLAPVYDLEEAVLERIAFSHWRERLWSQFLGSRVLEVGVGTGKNIPYHPKAVQTTAIDLSERMLAQAKHRVKELTSEPDLALADAQALPFTDTRVV